MAFQLDGLAKCESCSEVMNKINYWSHPKTPHGKVFHFSTPSLSCNVHILRAESLNVEKLKYITAVYFSRDISGYLSFFYKVDDSNIFEYCSLR